MEQPQISCISILEIWLAKNRAILVEIYWLNQTAPDLPDLARYFLDIW